MHTTWDEHTHGTCMSEMNTQRNLSGHTHTGAHMPVDTQVHDEVNTVKPNRDAHRDMHTSSCLRGAHASPRHACTCTSSTRSCPAQAGCPAGLDTQGRASPGHGCSKLLRGLRLPQQGLALRTEGIHLSQHALARPQDEAAEVGHLQLDLRMQAAC